MRTVLAGLIALCATTALVARADAKCSQLDCGTNSPVMKQFHFHELDLGQSYNAEGLKLGLLRKGLHVYLPDLVDSRLVGRNVFTHAIEIQGAQLAGSYLEVESNATPVDHFAIDIERVTDGLKLWVDPGEARYETYQLGWRGTGGEATHAVPLCPNPPGGKTTSEIYTRPRESILFMGDRYDAESKTLLGSTRVRSRFFNIACAGSAPFKLFMTRHTTATSDSTHQATVAERQAMLKLYVSDVCGNGDSFTEQGTPLHWDNLFGWGYLNAADYATEALWNENGAMCLTVHRLGVKHQAAIKACLPDPFPRCEDFPGFVAAQPTTWPAGALRISTLPYQP